ncbi:MAG: GGDEF domain-containing protein [Treponema sp.]|nr:GGDEF domain-containing protein [Treponema sp.]
MMRTVKRLALVIDYIESEYALKIHAGASKYAKDHGMELVVFPISKIMQNTGGYSYQSLSIASHLTSNNIDGIIFVSGSQLSNSTEEYLRSYIKSFAPVPVVSIGSIVKDVPSIICDGRIAFKNLISHLIEKHQCRRLAVMGVNDNSTDALSRIEVFKETLHEHNIAFDKSLVLYGSFSYDQAYKALNEYRNLKGCIDFDAIVALNDQMAYASIDWLQHNRKKVPGDVLVTGFDDELRSSSMTPTLTTINQNSELQGALAVETLIRMMKGEKVEKLGLVPPITVFRQSCSCVPLSDATISLDENGRIIPYDPKEMMSSVGEWCLKRAQFTQVIHLYTEMQNDMALSQFRERINTDLITLGILSAAVVLFESPISTDRFEYFPLPQKALLYSAYDRFSGYWLGEQETPLLFNPRETMVPEDVFVSMDGMQVQALYRSSTLFGYLIFRPGNYDPTVYTMVCKMLSNAISSAISITRAQEEKKELKKEYDVAAHISVTDDLTGLLNRRGFLDYGQKSLKVSQVTGRGGMVLFGDIDGLKKINDSYGHAAGDIAIKAEAQLLSRTFRHTDIIGRLGGDEFAIVAPNLTERKLDIARRRLENYCDEWNKNSDQEFELSISLGYAIYEPYGEEELLSLLEKADTVLYNEKKIKKAFMKKED